MKTVMKIGRGFWKCMIGKGGEDFACPVKCSPRWMAKPIQWGRSLFNGVILNRLCGEEKTI